MGKSTKLKTAPEKPGKGPAQPAAPAVAETVEIVGSQQDYERFLPLAKALDERDVRPFRIDPSLAFHNVQRGVNALLEVADRIAEELPKVDLEELRSLPQLALAVSFAASQVDRGGGTSKQLAEPLRRAYALRETMLTSAISLAVSGTVPKRPVEKIQKGRGRIDAAQDCVDLAAFFTEHAAAVRGKTPVTGAQITEAATVGTDLIKALVPRKGKRDRSPKGALKDAIAKRDRMATLLHQRHELARRVGHWLWGDEVDNYVPALQGRVAPKRKASKAATVAETSAAKQAKGEPQGKGEP